MGKYIILVENTLRLPPLPAPMDVFTCSPTPIFMHPRNWAVIGVIKMAANINARRCGIAIWLNWGSDRDFVGLWCLEIVLEEESGCESGIRVHLGRRMWSIELFTGRLLTLVQRQQLPPVTGSCCITLRANTRVDFIRAMLTLWIIWGSSGGSAGI